MDSVKEEADIMRSNKRGKGMSKGVSLIESLVALLVFMFGVLGWLGLEMAIAEESLQTQARSQAAFIANSTADTLKQMPYGDLVGSGADGSIYYDQYANQADVASSIFKVYWESIIVPVNTAEYKDVTIHVEWKTNKDGSTSIMDLKFERTP